MKFGQLSLDEAEGAILAHSLPIERGSIRKGTRLRHGHLEALRKAGFAEVVAASLGADDVHEDEAAFRLAKAVAGPGVLVEAPFTGRSNLHADAAGVLTIDRAAIDRLNRLDPSITLATLPEFSSVEAGRMVATVKIIPFAAPAQALANAEAVARLAPPLSVRPYRDLSVGLVATELPALKRSVMDKTRRILDARLAKAGSVVAEERRVAHQAAAVADALRAEKAAGRDLLIIFGASAVVDADDVLPAGIEAAGGIVRHLGMPVDPGNLLILGELGGTPVLGAPGCARSPVENGFDWVLDRLLAGIEVTPEDITGMGVGGLLMEIVSRPQPREREQPPKVAALVLAAGLSSRMGGPNKLLAEIGGKPVVRIVAEAALASRLRGVTVVTGHMQAAVVEKLAGLDLRLVHNPDYAGGLSTSLRAGIENLPKDIDGVLVLLADMPSITAETIDRLIAAFDADKGPVVVPTFDGRRGNPVLWPRRFFPELRTISGDKGARDLIAAHEEAVATVEIGEAAALDLDTPQALAAAGAVLVGS